MAIPHIHLLQAFILIPGARLPGMTYRPEFIDREEEARLVALIREFPFAHARYREFTARRRTVSFGGSYDFSEQALQPAAPIPEPVRVF